MIGGESIIEHWNDYVWIPPRIGDRLLGSHAFDCHCTCLTSLSTSWMHRRFSLRPCPTSLVRLKSQVPGSVTWQQEQKLGKPTDGSCSPLCWLRFWPSKREYHSQTLTVRIWLLCRAATVGKPGRPYGCGTTPKQHGTKRHTDISPVDKQKQGACVKLPLPA